MEWFVTDDGKYRIENLSAATIPGALEVIRYSFCNDESLCIGTEVDKNPIAAEELVELCAHTALDGVSLVAAVVDTGEVAAVIFNKLLEPSTNEKPFFVIFAEQRCTQPSSKALINFAADIDEKVNLFDTYGIDCSMEIMFLGISRHHRNNRLATLLCKYTIEVAKKLKNGPIATITVQDLGPKYSHIPSRAITKNYPKICHGLCTSAYSQKIGKSFGFTVHLRVSLEEFVYNEKSCTERIGSDPFCEVVALKLY